jgi:hypothetical protein
MKKSLVALSVLSGITLAPQVFAADLLCTTSSTSTAGINETVNFSVSARGSYTPGSVSVPIKVYFSQDSVRGGHDVLLASTSVLSSNGNCSSMKQLTATMTANSTGLGCFTPGQSAYYLFETANDLRATSVGLKGSYPEITSVYPSSAQPGMPFHIYGSGFTEANTAVFFGNLQASRAILSSTEILAVVPEGASASTVEVRHYENGGQFCVPPLSTAQFNVQPATCDSRAAYSGYGHFSSFAGAASPTCTEYMNFMDYEFGEVPKGNAMGVNFEIGTCGQPDYAKLFKFYVDWNQDSLFSELDELQLTVPSISANTPYTLTIPVPTTATVGVVKARMIMALYYSGLVDTTADVTACSSYPFGETIDFTIQVSQNSEGVMVAEIADKDAFKAALKAFEHKTSTDNKGQMLDGSIAPLEDAEVPKIEDIKFGFPTMGPQERIVERRE